MISNVMVVFISSATGPSFLTNFLLLFLFPSFVGDMFATYVFCRL